MPEPEVLAKLIDRACELSEQAIGRPPDRREMAEKLMAWYRVLHPLLTRRNTR